jgi:IS30 family transposase
MSIHVTVADKQIFITVKIEVTECRSPSNERATNENTNGLLRQYSPKKTGFRDISHHALAYVTARLNNRPRKRLNYLTPLETLNKVGFALPM